MASFLKLKTDKPDIPDRQDESPIFFMYIFNVWTFFHVWTRVATAFADLFIRRPSFKVSRRALKRTFTWSIFFSRDHDLIKH